MSRLLNGALDLTIGAEGERDEPLDFKVRELAALAYLVATCEALGIEMDEEWDRFMYARAIHRRVTAVLYADGLRAFHAQVANDLDADREACACGLDMASHAAHVADLLAAASRRTEVGAESC